ncbi:hypothetical protein TRAPUB_3829 [Trametes pubescens]|uniref:Uncharacterized protein n=1 Tax=Trametes pubescens TaxID=154538 RepID=A0A1M2VCW8_TRAPU|nr:hypothetical protein TRAPUB_3829 [Trametes pubescens]
MAQGAVKRMNAEKESPSITYEAFVEDLDEGDAFTASLFDILVKEMAERRTRPDPADRRFISERTAKALNMQAASRIYNTAHGSHRSRTARRSFPVLPPRYSSFHDVLSESDGDEDYGTTLINPGPFEGARINTDLYDAYFPSTVDLPSTLSRRTTSDVESPPPLPPISSMDPSNTIRRRSSARTRSPPTARSILYSGLGGASSSSLTRQPTIRRPYHSRTMDFNEFTARRRSAIRDSAAEEDGPRIDSTETAARPTLFGARTSSLADEPSTHGIRSWSSARRRSMPTELGRTSGGNAETTSATTSDWPSASSSTRGPSSSQLWYSLTSPLVPPPVTVGAPGPSPADSDGERPQVVAPRLRRGGLRPPEMVLVHHHDPTHPDGFHVPPPPSSAVPVSVGSESPPLYDGATVLHGTEPSADDSR